MAADASTPLPHRPSAADRERVARLLREGSVDGRLSLDTFSERIERTFAAHSRAELDALAADLQPPGPFRRALGTRVNGARLLDEAEVGPGDRVSFGDARFRLGEARRSAAT